MLFSWYFALATILLASQKVSAKSASTRIAKKSRTFEDPQYSLNHEKSILEEDGSERGAFDSDDIDGKVAKDDWRESSLEELTAATGSNPSYFSDRKNQLTNEMKTNDRQTIGESEAVPGKPGKDYPNLESIPATSFSCVKKKPGGYYADVETGCQVFHVCNFGNVKSSFLCPTGSIFNQRYSVCDWWYDFNCNEALDFYEKKSTQVTSQSDQNDNYKKGEGKKNLDPEENKRKESLEGSNDASRNESEGDDRFNKNQENRYSAPRGFSRNKSLRQKITAKGSTNNLANDVNFAYFKAGSYNENVYERPVDGKDLGESR